MVDRPKTLSFKYESKCSCRDMGGRTLPRIGDTVCVVVVVLLLLADDRLPG